MITPSKDTELDAELGAEAAEGDHAEGNEQCVPLAALSLEGTAPAVGDAVEFTVAGKVTRIEGGHAYIAVETLNGEPLPQQASPAEADAAMMDEARAADAAAEKFP